MKYPLSVSTWDDLEIAAIQKVVSSGNFTMGENVKEFENKFAEFVGSKYCVMVNSGSSANLLMIASLFYKQDHRLKKMMKLLFLLFHGQPLIIQFLNMD